jgi:membrane-bound lytic murein transglycosylase D
MPPTPRPVPVDVAALEQPTVEPSPLANSVPALLDNVATGTAGQKRSDSLLDRAQRHFEQGRKFYQINETEQARTEFDAAIDLMLEASQSPSNRERYESKLEEMVDAIHRYDLEGLGSAAPIDEPQFEKAPLEDILTMTFPVDPSIKNKVLEEVQATVSQLPLSTNDAVLGYIHYFSGRGHNTLIAGLQRAGRYRPMIQRILDEEGLPPEIIHLAQAESGFLPRAVSRKAAAGMWQFVAWRGKEYGLEQNRLADDRLDPEKATRAAARHLRDLYQRFGDWYLAIAAYNCGPGNVEKAVERTGFADFWELRSRRVLPAETTNYVPIILAMTIMAKNATAYGLEGVVPESPVDYDTLRVTHPTQLALVSDLTEIPVSQLSALNPALLRGLIPANYSLRVPKGLAGSLVAALDLVPAERRASWRLHKVEAGETMATIGKRYHTTPATILAANHLDQSSPLAGDRLLIPLAYQEPSPAKSAAKRPAAKRAAARRQSRPNTAPARRVSSTFRKSQGPVALATR